MAYSEIPKFHQFCRKRGLRIICLIVQKILSPLIFWRIHQKIPDKNLQGQSAGLQLGYLPPILSLNRLTLLYRHLLIEAVRVHRNFADYALSEAFWYFHQVNDSLFGLLYPFAISFIRMFNFNMCDKNKGSKITPMYATIN